MTTSKTASTPRVSIVGYGRFGQVLYRLLKDDFPVTLYRRHPITDTTGFTPSTRIAKSIAEIYKSDVIFFATPIETFEKVIAAHKKYFRKDHLLIDVLSVKMYPAVVLAHYLKGTGVAAMLTHPMFGPDSSKGGFAGLPMIMDRFLATPEQYDFWKTFFAGKELRIVEISAKEHDYLAANSQGLTHFIGRLLAAYDMQPTPIDSTGAKKLLEVKEQINHDTWQLFRNLQRYNPYTLKMRLRLGEQYDKLYAKLFPRQIHSGYAVYGIQGGKGSFNEKAIYHYFEKEGITNYQIRYLHTSARVLKALHEGEIDYGQFAIHNSIGGIVGESVEAMARYKFRIIDEFAIIIAHALMIRPDATLSGITTIITHPQVLAQCKTTLAQKYPNLKKTSGKGQLVDHALVAKRLAEGKLPKDVATMGSDILAKIYGLKVVENNLQDAKENYTSFLVVSRR